MWFCNGVEAVHERLTELADESGAESSRSIHKIVVEAPAPLLAGGLILADTPGFGAAQAAGAQGTHEESLRSYLREDVSQVFWVVLAEQGIGKREKSFHDEFLEAVCDDVVVTGCEDWEPLDRQRFRRRFAQGMTTFHFVSGLQGLLARAADDSAGLESAGITLLETRIRELSEPAGRDRAIQRALIQLADDISYWMLESPTRRGKAMNCLWRPDSWDRWLACGANHELVGDLARRLTFEP